MGKHLGVRLGSEPVAARDEPLLQLGVVLENAVVDHRQISRAVSMRVRIRVRGASMGRPARVPHAHGALHGLLRHDGGKLGHLSGPSPDREPRRAHHRDASRVVPPVLDASEPIEENPTRLPIANVADDSTHFRAHSSGLPWMGSTLLRDGTLLHGSPSRP
jgi:hypothetical protein